MADLRNYYYRYEWVGQETGWDYRLKFILPCTGYSNNSFALENPEVIDIKEDHIIIEELKSVRSDWIAGLQNSSGLSMKLNLGYMTEPEYDGLKDCIFNTQEIQWAFDSEEGIYMQYPSGIVVRLYIRFNGNDMSEIAPYREVFNGIYVTDGKVTLDGEANQVQISFISLAKHVLESISLGDTSIIYYTYTTEIESQTEYEDFQIEDLNSYDWPLEYNVESDIKIIFMTISDFHDRIQQIATLMKEKMCRSTDELFEYYLPYRTHYVQGASIANDKGDQIVPGGWYFIKNIQQKDKYEYGEWVYKVLDGLLSTGTKSLYKIFGNAWDYTKAYMEEHCHCGMISNLGLSSLPIDVSNSSVEISLSEVNNCKMVVNNDKYKTITVTPYEKIGADPQNVEKKTGALSGAGWSVPIIYNNTPITMVYSDYKKDGMYWKENHALRLHGIYYPDLSAPWGAYPNITYGKSMVRVHEIFDLTISDTKKLSDLVTQTPVSKSNVMNKPDQIAANIAKSLGIPNITASLYAKFFKKGIDIVEFETQYSDYVMFGSGYAGWIWCLENFNNDNFEIDIASMFNITYTAGYRLMESTLKFDTEQVSAKFMSLKY